jgi:transposase
MDRTDLQQLSKEQLIDLVLRLQRPDKNSRTSSKPPSTDKKEKRENSRPGGAKPGHEPHNRRLADNPDEFRDHMPSVCAHTTRSRLRRSNPMSCATGASPADAGIVASR